MYSVWESENNTKSTILTADAKLFGDYLSISGDSIRPTRTALTVNDVAMAA
jgi:hypothetical protein